MANVWEYAAGTSSVILRFSAYAFFRWIPGHHFPPIILTTAAIYLSIVWYKSERFKSKQAPLHELFPTLFVREEVIDPVTGEEKEIDIEIHYEEPIVYEDEHPFVKTLLCGIPDWRELDISLISIATNMVLALMTLDFVFRGPIFHPETGLRFSRVGYVDATTAKILLREPDPQQLPIYTYYKADGETKWSETDRLYYISSDTDYTRSIQLTGLSPDTTYMYTLSNTLNGTFQTAPVKGSPASNTLTFLTSSCIKANFPYKPFSHSLTIHGFTYLSDLVKSLRSPPAFMLFVGDFIYVDVPRRLSSTVSHYRSEYRRVYASPSWSLPGLGSLPWFHTLDDHEIANDWSGGNETSPFPQASDPFLHYHVSVNPPVPPQSAFGPYGNTTYFQFTRGPASFFLLDTRRYRTNPETESTNGSISSSSKPLYGSSSESSNPPIGQATMLGQAQLNDLLGFLSTPEPPHVHWKIVASSVPFTKNWRFGTSDTWGGFLLERATILSAMHHAEATLGVRVIVLSGDRHEFAAIRFPAPIASHVPAATPALNENSTIQTATERHDKALYDPTPQAGPHEFSVGPLSMFYLPFRTFRQIDNEDVAIAYFPDGNSKIGVIEIENLGADTGASSAAGSGLLGKWIINQAGGGGERGKARVNAGVSQRSMLKYSLWIDGKKSWDYVLLSPSPESY